MPYQYTYQQRLSQGLEWGFPRGHGIVLTTDFRRCAGTVLAAAALVGVLAGCSLAGPAAGNRITVQIALADYTKF
jgi:hypothetical protein